MRRLWLIFAQTVTVLVAALFVVATLKPEWLAILEHSSRGATAPSVLNFSARTGGVTPQNTAPPVPASSSYRDAANKALPSVVHVYTTQKIRRRAHPFFNDPIFRHFFGTPNEEEDGDGEADGEGHSFDAPGNASGLGSGVIVRPDGYILTNNHVIESADSIEVALNDGRKLKAKVIGSDPESDLAVLKVDPGKDSGPPLPAITFASMDNVRVGDVVLAIGNPFGVGQTVTMGIVSALGRSQLGINTFENFIQTDAAINPGNSGGALTDAQGNLIGINTAIFSRSGGSLGIGFAIPVSTAHDVMEQIIRTGSVTRGWIGVEVQELTPELAESFNLPQAQGTLIAGVQRGGPAATAGIKPGDILFTIDGHQVNNPQEMRDLIAAQKPGAQMLFKLQRNQEEVEVKVAIGKRPVSRK